MLSPFNRGSFQAGIYLKGLMSKSSLMTDFRLVVVLTMIIGAVSLLSHTASLHNPELPQAVEQVLHSSLPIAAVDGDHVHDKGAQKERQPGHVHGHNSADHSHETIGSAIVLAEPGCAEGTASQSQPRQNIYGEPFFRLDRPPRHGFPS
ncbi:hypothetical protein JL100_000615 [Skermanella mucosa]|uniref:hypothetical protein n=1 Tax=Skermanella mucosa TaxID=1789672 RepID=UPI00192CC763|nr:hypothetical protein [Skermanella mucosa]UEM21325.1 hypothetical protein JL100_000615 [Skermanella mucosa]